MSGINKEIEERRKNLVDLSIPKDASKKWGLALSGGGIRSATFCFGLLRALAHRRLLLRFDLLSTVSGGGYIGSTIGSLFNRAKDVTEAAEVEKAIDGRLSGDGNVGQSGAEEPTSWFLWWLRANGRYLIPRGVKDTTFAVALYARNLAGIHLELGLIAIMLGLGLSAIDLVVWWAVERLGFLFASRDFFELIRWLPGWLPTVSVVLPLVALSAARLGAAYWAVPWVQAHLPPPFPPVPTVPPNAPPKRHPFPAQLLAICAAVLVLDVVLSLLFYEYGTTDGVVGGVTRNVVWWSAAGLIALWAFGSVTAYRQLVNVSAENEAAAALQADTARNQLTKRFAQRLRVMALVVLVGLVDRVAWLFAFNELSVVNAGLALAFAAAVLRGLMPLVSSFTAGGTAGSGVMLFFGRIAGYLMTFLLTSWWVTLVYQVVLGSLFSGRELNYLDAWSVLLLFAVPVLGYVGGTGRNLGFLNLSSLHSFYRARLVRSYMGAANGKRFSGMSAQPLSALGKVDALMPVGDQGPSIDDVWPDDDAWLTSYKPQKSGGPVHLINVCVNQTRDPRGKHFNQDRRGLPLTVASGGLMRVSQDEWTQLGKGPGMSVGRWMAISGAAVAPGMGALTRGGAAALMTFAGVRLGYWWSEAERTGKVIAKSPLLTKSKVLLNELFGSFKGTAGTDWFLTDGGHFENTGAYALLAERAEVIVVADCGADPKYAFGDLENLIRIARVDLQAEIRFQRPHSKADPKQPETTALRNRNRLAKPPSVNVPSELDFFGSINDLASRDGTACLAMAKIVYGGATPGSGILILIKPNVCSGLPVDLLNFKAQFPDFPQQPTSDQFFSEAQWESYFLLGQFLGGKLNRGFIERILATPGEFFEDDDCSPFEQAKEGGGAGVKQAAAAVARLPARIGQSAVGATIGLGAVATVGVSTWQAIDSVRASYAKQTNDERAALKELTDLWAKVPAPAYGNATAKDTSLAISSLAAAIVRTADTLCPSGEAKWYVRSPVAAQITNDTIGWCGGLDVQGRNSACSMLLEAANPDLKSPLPTCLSWKAEREQSVPPPLYWGYDYSATRTIDYWHPCDPLRGALKTAEQSHFDRFGVLLSRQSAPTYGRGGPSEPSAAGCGRELGLWSLATKHYGSIEQSSSASEGAPAPSPAPTQGPPVTSPKPPNPPPAPPPASPPPQPPTATGSAPTGAETSVPPLPPSATAPAVPASVPNVTSRCEAATATELAKAMTGICKDIKVYVQTYGSPQLSEFSCYQTKWDTWLGAKRLAIEDVVASASAKGRPNPAPVRTTVIRYHGEDAIECASALGKVLGKDWPVEPLSAKYRSSRKTVEVWVAPENAGAVR